MKKIVSENTIKRPSLREGLVRLLLLIALFPVGIANATVKLPQLFQSGMVLQRNQIVPIW